jgi:peroxiredoxin
MKSARCWLAVLAVVGLGLGWTYLSSRNVTVADEPAASREMLGKKIPNLTFKTETGKTLSLHDDFKDKKATVLIFFSFECPISNTYPKPLADLHKQYGKHVGFLGLTVNQDDTRADVAKLAKKYDLPFPVVLDEKLVAADALKADVTPEVFILDADFVVRYRGRIDNTYYARLKKGADKHEPTCADLVQALAEVLSGRPVTTAATEPVGCPIQRPEKKPAKAGTVTYYRDVLPILQNKCQGCHRPGEVGPFSLMTYKQAYHWANDIKTYTQSRIMPPWKPTGGLPFHNERKLTDDEMATLAKWVDGGRPEGNPKDAPPLAKFPVGWQLGQPDLVLEPTADFQVGPTGKDVFRCFVLPSNFTEDKYVTAVEVRPGTPAVVHHCLVFVDTTGRARQLEADAQKNALKPPPGHDEVLDKGPGYTVSMGVGFIPTAGLGGWAPGSIARQLPAGYAYSLPKKGDVVVQVHYHRNGRLEKDRTKIGLYFAKGKQEMKPFQGGVIRGGSTGALGMFFAIPPGAERHKLTGTTWATGDCQLFAITPHMHLLGKEIKATLTPPEGKTVTLIHIKQWDYNWQETYFFKEPVKVPAGSKLEVEAYFDNSAKNPLNPNNPPQWVTFGEQTTNEMCFVFLGGASDRPGRRLPMTFTAPKKTAAK